MTELLPCPFCGGEAKPYDYWNKYLIECDDCVEYGHGAYVVARTEAEAITAWNTRAERTCHADEVTHRNCKYSINRGWRERTCKLDRNDVCNVCGASIERVTHSVYEMGDSFACHPNYCPNCGARVIA